MKFNFKIQDYQTDAVNSIVNCFIGQRYSDGLSYRRDVGNIKDMNLYSQAYMDLDSEVATLQLENDFDETGFKNDKLSLTPAELLSNIRKVQQNNNVSVSDSLIGDLGACSLDIEMETGERVIIVMGAINVLVSRFSGTFIKYNSCIA